MHYELTFDSADQKTALVRQVVNHLEKTKKYSENWLFIKCPCQFVEIVVPWYFSGD